MQALSVRPPLIARSDRRHLVLTGPCQAGSGKDSRRVDGAGVSGRSEGDNSNFAR